MKPARARSRTMIRQSNRTAASDVKSIRCTRSRAKPSTDYGRFPMADAAVKEKNAEANAAEAERELTDGFHLIIDALKLNGVKTIYDVPGIPVSDFLRMAQAEGIRVISFRHEQNAGNAAAMAGFLTRKPGVCVTVSAPGFLNGLT